MGLTEISREVGIYKSKGFSILNTLQQFGFVEKDPQTKTYSLGPGVISLSRNFLDKLNYLDIVTPYLEDLAKETNGTAVLGLINDKHVFAVGKREGNQNIGFTLRLGHSFHITLGAHGKAIAAFMPEAERKKLLAKKNLYFYGDPSRLDMRRLRHELPKCRELGFAQDIGEITPGVNVISAPVFGIRERMIGCIVLLGTFPESMIEKYGPEIADTARQISYKLGADIQTVYGNMNKATTRAFS
jgi:DNA-binding IclR family transcriptional regulator